MLAFAVAVLLLVAPCSLIAQETFCLIPMDAVQSDHLRAYGIAYWALQQGFKVEWLLNFRGGAFLTPDSRLLQVQSRLMGVSIEIIGADQREEILKAIGKGNMEVVLLEKPPKVAVYTPPDKRPWDDAVTLALVYAKIPYETLWDKEVLEGKLSKYDWLHLHHEDFTGQYGKFYATFHNAPWYQEQVRLYTLYAREAGFAKVQQHKCEVAKAIKGYVLTGGFLFAMCSATDTIDIALAAEGVDIVPPEIDGDGQDPSIDGKLDFGKTFAFERFSVIPSAYIYEYSNIDISNYQNVAHPELEDFTLFEFSAKIDPVETMLTQCHTNEIKGFFGQTTSFNRDFVKKGVRILAECPNQNRAKLIHGNLGRGTFTFYGGHDPEDFSHAVGDPPTDLSLHKNSPGYRMILNNILFPAAKKKKLKT
ncbi:MAG: asparagine synthetase B [Candidatus Riflebacteria bacterium]|nr:asparagine synthetase B [Candidatus Riflebacteria bacterium]